MDSYLIYTSRDSQQIIVLLSKGETTLGRRDDNDIFLLDEQTSKYHAIVMSSDSGCFLKDRASANGVRLNGVRIAANTLVALSEGDTVGVGTFDLLFSQKEDYGLLVSELGSKKSRTSSKDKLLKGERKSSKADLLSPLTPQQTRKPLNVDFVALNENIPKPEPQKKTNPMPSTPINDNTIEPKLSAKLNNAGEPIIKIDNEPSRAESVKAMAKRFEQSNIGIFYLKKDKTRSSSLSDSVKSIDKHPLPSRTQTLHSKHSNNFNDSLSKNNSGSSSSISSSRNTDVKRYQGPISPMNLEFWMAQKVTCKIIESKYLKTDAFEPYCVCRIDNDEATEFRTQTCADDSFWSEGFEIDVTTGFKELKFVVWNANKLGLDRPLGKVLLPKSRFHFLGV